MVFAYRWEDLWQFFLCLRSLMSKFSKIACVLQFIVAEKIKGNFEVGICRTTGNSFSSFHTKMFQQDYKIK